MSGANSMLRVRINWSGLNTGFSVMHFLPAVDDQASADDAAAAVTAWLQVLDNFLRVNQTAQVDPEVLEIQVATGTTLGSFTVSESPVTGADSNDAVPNASMALVRWRTGIYVSGREIRGRTFIPGLTEASLDANGNLGTTPISAIDAGSNLLIAGDPLAIYSPTRGSAATVTQASTWSEFAVLRSRR
jgi:hypothetical protein